MANNDFPQYDCGLPLGGIGAGKIEFCPDGRFTNATINNNWNCPITDGQARINPRPRVKEGFPGSVEENQAHRRMMYSPEGIPGTFLAAFTENHGVRVLKGCGRKSFKVLEPDNFEFSACFPKAEVNYHCFDPIRLSLKAFSSFPVPDLSADYQKSSLPLAFFVLEWENQSPHSESVAAAFSWQHLAGIGGYPSAPIHQPDPTPPCWREDKEGRGLWFDTACSETVDRRVWSDASLFFECDDPQVQVSFLNGWDPQGEGHEFWQPFSETGTLPNQNQHYAAGALCLNTKLEAGARQSMVFVLAWHAPHLLAAESDWSVLSHGGGAPPPISHKDRPDYGHRYTQWFVQSWQAAAYGLKHWQDVDQQIDQWHDHLKNSTLPPFFSQTLCNDLFPLVSNSWYTADGRFTIDESPTDMSGCLGTIDQRSVASAFVTMTMPHLDRSELQLFADDQIDENDDRRYGQHVNTLTGQFDLTLDRKGAILHEVGWEHLEGGRTGDPGWLSAHWPDLSSVFVLQVWHHVLRYGDDDWLASIYPRVKSALQFQKTLDQDDDGVPELWGPGCNTYDTEIYAYYGASSFVASLTLAALKAAQKMAMCQKDQDFSDWCEQWFRKCQQTMEECLWDDEHGHYHSWVDRHHKAWPAERRHDASSNSCQIAQLAGCWWADCLNLGPLVDPKRRRQALQTIFERNGSLEGAPADEMSRDGHASQSFTPYAMVYFAAQAIQLGMVKQGWECFEKIDQAYRQDTATPWDKSLQLAGEQNRQMQWGRWYMSHPASWYVLQALHGVVYHKHSKRLIIKPQSLSAWTEQECFPVFSTDMRLSLSCEPSPDQIKIQLEKKDNGPGVWDLETITLALHRPYKNVSFEGKAWSLSSQNDGCYETEVKLPLSLDNHQKAFVFTMS